MPHEQMYSNVDTWASEKALLENAAFQTALWLRRDCSNQGVSRSGWKMCDLGSSLLSQALLTPLSAMSSTLTPEPPLPPGLTNDRYRRERGLALGT